MKAGLIKTYDFRYFVELLLLAEGIHFFDRITTDFLLMKLNYQGLDVNFPDIFIVGAAKSGTTSLAFYLKQHPDVAIPRKEPGFFAFHGSAPHEIPSGIRDRQVVEVKAFAELNKSVKPNQKLCDSSVAYLTNYAQTIANIKKIYGNRIDELKFTIVLRNPVDRAFSHYLMFVKNGLESLGFEEAIKPEVVASRVSKQLGFDYLGNSLYYERTKAFLDNFKHVKIYLTEDLKDSQAVMKDYLEFLDLNNQVNINTDVKLNPSGIPKNKGIVRSLHKRSKLKDYLKRILPDNIQYKLISVKSQLLERNIERVNIDQELKARLVDEYFKEDILAMQKLLGRDLGNWLNMRNKV